MAATTAGVVTPIITDASSIKFKWQISPYWRAIQFCKKGDFLKSPEFTIDLSTDIAALNNIQWHLRLYPNESYTENGDSDWDDDGYVKLCGFYLYVNNSMQPVTSFKICNAASQELKTENHTKFPYLAREYEKLIRKAHLLNPANGVLYNQTKFTIVCELTSSKTNLEKNKQGDVLPRLQNEYEALLTNSKFSDLSLIAEGKAVKVHKCIIANRSSVFAAMFNADMKEKQENAVEISDLKYDVLVEMVRFIYAEKINNIDTLAGELAVAADKYALDVLKNMCEKAMKKNLTLDNVISCVQLAETLRMDSLKESAIVFMIKNASDISDRVEFNLLSHDILRKILRCLAETKK